MHNLNIFYPLGECNAGRIPRQELPQPARRAGAQSCCVHRQDAARYPCPRHQAEGRPYLLKSAVVYGANASGKSNLIKALQYMRGVVLESAALQPGQTFDRLQPFKLYRV